MFQQVDVNKDMSKAIKKLLNTKREDFRCQIRKQETLNKLEESRHKLKLSTGLYNNNNNDINSQ
jgi:hypothetical protein